MANRKQKEKKVRSLYFAYGSNMNHEHMKFRCPKSKYVSTYTLPGYELVFRGVADVQKAEDKQVTGALFEITDDCERALDVYEGYPNLYTKKYVNRWYDDMRKFTPEKIMFYSMVDKQVVYPPFEGYLNTIIGGYKDCKLSTDPLKAAVDYSVQRLD